MRILFIAKFDAGQNEDELAVSHALTELGHEVLHVHERNCEQALGVQADLCLFFKWFNVHVLRRLKMPKCFWWFDLVQHADRTLKARSLARISWMNKVVPFVDLGFLTDGDFVAQDRTGKLVWLTQGADERVIGKGEPSGNCSPCLLFPGITRGGMGRQAFVRDMGQRYGNRFVQVEHGLYRRDLANRIAEAEIVVCPDHPTGPAYWSNRVYNAAGFGACVLHPYCEFLTSHYEEGVEILFYRDREQLHEQIGRVLEDAPYRRELAANALERTNRQHLYRHRVQRLLEVCRERKVI